MFLKKHNFRKKQILLKLKYIKNDLKKLIHKSLLKNHYNNYIFRLSFTIDYYFDKKKNHFVSLQKLFCPFTIDKKIPSKHYMFSRFFLNKKLNSLRISNTFK